MSNDIVMICLSGKKINQYTYIKKYLYSLGRQKLLEPKMIDKSDDNRWEDEYYLMPGKYLVIEINLDNAKHSCTCKCLKVFSRDDYLSDKIKNIPNADIKVFKKLYRFGGWEIGEWEGFVPDWIELPCKCLDSWKRIILPEIDESEEDRQKRINYKQPKEVEDKLGTLLLNEDGEQKTSARLLIHKNKLLNKR